MAKRKKRIKPVETAQAKDDDFDSSPDWTSECENCGATPTVTDSGMCGPCTFGEADTAGGNW